MRKFLDHMRGLPVDQTATHLAFGDLFLEDIRKYRESKLEGTGFTPLFPIWGLPTPELAETMISNGLRAIVTALNPSMLPESFAGRWFNREFLRDLPDGVDPLGENGEFHTCVVDGPMFPKPINARTGQIVTRNITDSSINDDDTIHKNNTTPAIVYADVELLD